MARAIRPMQPDDLDQVMEIDSTAFSDLFTRFEHRPVHLPTHEREYFEFWIQSDRGGALVEEEDGRIRGFICCHPRCRMAWVGPLAVRTELHGQGTGKRLMNAALRVMDDLGVEVVGLDTFARNPISVSLYLKSGFHVHGGVFMLDGSLESEPSFPEPPVPIEVACPADVPALAKLEEEVTGFDRTADYEFLVRSDLGQGFKIAEGDRIRGFVFCVIRRGMGQVCSLYLDEDLDTARHVQALTASAGRYFRSKGLKGMSVLCRGSEKRLFRALFARGFRLSMTMLTMHRTRQPLAGPVASPLAIEKG